MRIKRKYPKRVETYFGWYFEPQTITIKARAAKTDKGE